MVAMAVMGILTAGLMTVMDTGNKEVKSLQQKIEILQAEQEIMRDLSDPGICACNFDPAKNTANGAPLTFDTANTASQISLKQLYATCVSNVPGTPIAAEGQRLPGTGTGVTVSTIRMRGFTPTGTGRYRAQIEVAFDSDSLELSRRPATIPITLNATGNPATITGCSTGKDVAGIGGGAGAGGGCPAATLNYYGPMGPNLPDAPPGTFYSVGTGTYSMNQSTCGDYYLCDIVSLNPLTYDWRPHMVSCPSSSDGP